MTITLTGFMGSGKTTVGRALAARLGWPFIDLDEAIETAAGRTIPQIFESEGETAFRHLETDTLSGILAGAPENLVLALGGGTILREESASLIRSKCLCIWLKASAEELRRNLSDQASGRPLLAGEDLAVRIGNLLSEREASYRNAADITVDVDGLASEKAAEMIEIRIKDI